MSYDQGLAHRLREVLAERHDVREKEMFGGLAFLIGGAMSVGIIGEELMVRVGPARHEAALARSHARIMDFTGRPMKGWIIVAPAGFEEDADLVSWVAWGVAAAVEAPKTKPKKAASKGAVPPSAKKVTKRAGSTAKPQGRKLAARAAKQARRA